jgi:OmpA-OmpF porin, OOP family
MHIFSLKKALTTTLLLVVCFNFVVSAQEKAKRFPHPLVSGPAGYNFDDDTQVTEFGTFTRGSFGEFKCQGLKKCADNLPGFKDGKFVAEGKITKVFYRNDQKPAGELAILRSYENIFLQIGGIKLTGQDAPIVGSHLFYVKDKNTWMILDNSNNIVQLTFLEQKNMEQLVTAGQLLDQINKQGFANLNVNFDTNKSIIKDSDKAAINEVVTLLKNDPKLKLSVEGHTDNVGAAGANKSLSQARSDSLLAYMVAAGVPAGRLVAKGFGSEVPVADNRSEEGKAKNRRVELVKIK